MADFDTKVLYLETPPTSAPKTSYTIGVRILNQGVADAVASGYVQVFDKDTGLLVKTYQVESAVIAPEEEKQAFASEVWDLTDAEIGKQFILSGMVTSPGDTVPSNDILNPTTVTVIAGEPPDPPAVTPHKSQHEDGGNDEINVDGLFGQLHDPQELAAHASSHEVDGADELNIGGLPGQAADRQLPTVHGNDEHSPDFASEEYADTAIVMHNARITPHDAAENIERPANKGQNDGYCGLNPAGLVSAADLGVATGPLIRSCNLNGYNIWAQPVAGCAAANIILLNAGSGSVTLGSSFFGVGWLQTANGVVGIEAGIFGRADVLTPGDTVTFKLFVWPTAGGPTPALHTVVWTAAPTDNDVVFHGHIRATWDPANNQIVGFGDVVALDVGGGPNAESHVMPAETATAWFNPTQEITAYASVQVVGAGITGHNFNGNIQTNQQMDY